MEADRSAATASSGVTIRIVITEDDLREALVRTLNGERVAPDFAWGILHRWDRTRDD